MKLYMALLVGPVFLGACTENNPARQTPPAPKTWVCSWSKPLRAISSTDLEAPPLHEAARTLQVSWVRRLVTPENVNAVSGMQQTALFQVTHAPIPWPNEMGLPGNTDFPKRQKAKAISRLEIAKILLAAGADVNLQDKNGKTPLMDSFFSYAPIEPYQTELVNLLIEKTNLPNLQDKDGTTALMLAADHDNVNAVVRLRAKGANITLTRCDGKSALDLARERKSPEIIAALTN